MITITSSNFTGLTPLPALPEEDLRLSPAEELPFRQRLIREMNERYGPIPKDKRTEEDNYQIRILRNRIDESRRRCPLTPEQKEKTKELFRKAEEQAFGK
jgi:hypothetical protein